MGATAPAPAAPRSRTTATGSPKAASVCATAGRGAPFFADLFQIVAREYRRHLRQRDGRRMAVQATHHPGRGRPGVADQHQQHLDDDGRVQDERADGTGAMVIDPGLAPAALGFSEHRVAVQIEVEPAHPLSLYVRLAVRRQQHHLHAHAQQRLEFLLREARARFPHQASHRCRQRPVAGKMHIAKRGESPAIEPGGIAVGVVTPVVVVAAQIRDLLEVAKGRGARGIAQRGPQLLERCRLSAPTPPVPERPG